MVDVFRLVLSPECIVYNSFIYLLMAMPISPQLIGPTNKSLWGNPDSNYCISI